VDVLRVAFIAPAIPRLRASPPTGEGWLHEVKLDGFRVQLHKHSQVATVYSKNGADFTRRFPAIAAAVLALPVGSCIIDGELVAPGSGKQRPMGGFSRSGTAEPRTTSAATTRFEAGR
jgi:ATP-dependent DNA ligase